MFLLYEYDIFFGISNNIIIPILAFFIFGIDRIEAPQ